MKIDREEARRVAQLASLTFEDAELSRMADEMSKILDYVDQIRAIDTSHVSDRQTAGETSLRDDIVSDGAIEDAAKANAPEMRHRHFVVPRVIGGN